MRYLVAFGLFWYDFVVGDDWSIAVGVVVAIAAAALLVNTGINAFWLVPLAVLGLLAASLWRASSGA
ncbi:MAG: hypothetical protein QOG33_1634 [Gaiellales bacterium]|nr:hypothetical protein [Gaiellales bacterium]